MLSESASDFEIHIRTNRKADYFKRNEAFIREIRSHSYYVPFKNLFKLIKKLNRPVFSVSGRLVANRFILRLFFLFAARQVFFELRKRFQIA